MDVVTLALAKKYVNATATGMGAVKGAPCQISSIEELDNQMKIVFSWKDNLGATHTSDLLFPKGKTYQPGQNVTITNDNTISVKVDKDLVQESVENVIGDLFATKEDIDAMFDDLLDEPIATE